MSTIFRLPQIKYITFLFLLFSIIIGELGRVHIFGSLYISLIDIAALIFLIVNSNIASLSKKVVHKKYLIWTVSIFLIMIVTLLAQIFNTPINEIGVGLLYPLRWIVFLLIPIAVMIFCSENKQLTQLTERNYLATFIILAILGFLQLLIYPNLGMLEQYGYDPHYLRLTSTWLDPNFVGAAFVLGILLYAAIKQRKYTNIAISILFIALLCTFSRSSYLLFGVCGISFSLVRRSWCAFCCVVVGCILLYLSFAIPRQNLEKSRNIDRYVSANSRIISYSQGVRFFQDHPFVGIGYNLVRFQRKQYGMIAESTEGGNSGAGIDSSWIFVLATTGILGLTIFLAYWIRVLYFIIEPARVEKTRFLYTSLGFLINASAKEHALFSFFIGWSVHSWFINSLFFTPLLALWGIGLGFLFSRK
jgi:hypothetical protein